MSALVDITLLNMSLWAILDMCNGQDTQWMQRIAKNNNNPQTKTRPYVYLASRIINKLFHLSCKSHRHEHLIHTISPLFFPFHGLLWIIAKIYFQMLWSTYESEMCVYLAETVCNVCIFLLSTNEVSQKLWGVQGKQWSGSGCRVGIYAGSSW